MGLPEDYLDALAGAIGSFKPSAPSEHSLQGVRALAFARAHR